MSQLLFYHCSINILVPTQNLSHINNNLYNIALYPFLPDFLYTTNKPYIYFHIVMQGLTWVCWSILCREREIYMEKQIATKRYIEEDSVARQKWKQLERRRMEEENMEILKFASLQQEREEERMENKRAQEEAKATVQKNVSIKLMIALISSCLFICLFVCVCHMRLCRVWMRERGYGKQRRQWGGQGYGREGCEQMYKFVFLFAHLSLCLCVCTILLVCLYLGALFKNHSLALDIFNALSISSHLWCN